MQLSRKARGRLRTRESHHLLMTESWSILVQKVPGERVVMKAVLKAVMIDDTDYCISLKSSLKSKSNNFNPRQIILLLQLLEMYRNIYMYITAPHWET